MSELLAPAGSFDALIAAISNGANAIYLGMNRFGARAYASNFDEEGLKKAVQYAHLRNVKLYVTLNTIIFEEELKDSYQMIDNLYTSGVDGVIVQDLAILDYIVKHYPKLEAHCSTQMGIDDAEGTLLFKELGAKRVVLAREVEIEKIKEIKKITNIPLEIFIHGALCVSYSGNCLMSGLIGFLSGNRGRCVGSCRKPYIIKDITNQIQYDKSYLLSMKDLNTLSNINELKMIDSLKIEGRMKEPEYVANVVSAYRQALDEKKSTFDLNKTFHRTFTKGYIFHEDKAEITNILKPNNYGYEIGKIGNKTKKGYQIILSKPLNQNDIIRINHNQEDVVLITTKLYDEKDNLIRFAERSCFIKIKEQLSIGDIVYKTKDVAYYKKLSNSYPREFKRFPIQLTVYAYAGTRLTILAECEKKRVVFESEAILDIAKTRPTTKEQFLEQFDRLNNTIYTISSFDYEANEVFIPLKLINEARREIIEKMNEERLFLKRPEKINSLNFTPYPHLKNQTILAVYATTKEQYEAAKECGIEIIYYKDNVIRRNSVEYKEKNGPLLIGGYGGIYAYRNKNQMVGDFSLNVVNSKAVHLLHSLGVERVTLSYEINKKQIQTLLAAYQKDNQGYPNLEMIVYGNSHLLHTKYCPLKKFNLCGVCKKNQYVLEDEYGSFPILSHNDCTTTILNGKTLNLIDELADLKDIQVLRLQFTMEAKEKTKKIIQAFQNKLAGKPTDFHFNSLTDTRGHFNKEIL